MGITYRIKMILNWIILKKIKTDENKNSGRFLSLQ
jgi:hypothetical protein